MTSLIVFFLNTFHPSNYNYFVLKKKKKKINLLKNEKKKKISLKILITNLLTRFMWILEISNFCVIKLSQD